MARGFVFGLLGGTFFGAIVLSLASLLSEVPGVKAPDAAANLPDSVAAPEIIESTGVAEPAAEARPSTTVTAAPVSDSGSLAILGPEITSPGVQPQLAIESSATLGRPQASEASPTLGTAEQNEISNRSAPELSSQPAEPVDIAQEQPIISTEPADEPAPKPEPEVEVASVEEIIDTTPEVPTEEVTAQESDPNQEATSMPNAEANKPALVAFAVPFEKTDDKPLFSIVILDDADSEIGPAALDSFPLPLTIAIDPTHPKAHDRMLAFAAAGFEIATQVPSSVRMTPEEVAAFAPVLPLSVAIVEPQSPAFGGDGATVRAVTAKINDQGLGLLTRDTRGDVVGASQAVDLPFTSTFLDLDGSNQRPAVVRRFMDQAAFKARQQGKTVLLSRLRPDTISAFLIWAQQTRVNTVSVAPLSAVLLAD